MIIKAKKMILVFISLCVFCACVFGLAFLQGVETKQANASVFTHTEEVRMKKGVAVSDTFLDGKKGYLFETERNGASVVFGEGFSGKFSIESSPIAAALSSRMTSDIAITPSKAPPRIKKRGVFPSLANFS